MRRHFAFVACALAIGACAVNHDSGAGATATIPPPSTTTYDVALNTESGVVAGAQAGYGVRTLATPNTFRFIWTGDGDSGGGYHEFWGSVWTTGHFSDQVPGCTNGSCALESGDFVSAPYATTGGQRIDWDTFADDGLDGFEVTTDQVPLFVDAYIDGVRYPSLFFFPDATQNGDIATVTTIPCAFTTQQ